VSLAFDHRPGPRIVYGPGSLDRLGELVRELPARRVLLVTDRGVRAAGHLAHALKALRLAGVSAVVFDRVIPNPTTRCVDNCRDLARRSRIEAIVGLGGGSSLDTAKGCNFLLTNGGRMQDYWGTGKAREPMLPLVAIPTTAGTGSECQSYALITDERTHRKMACGDPKALARVAILDPVLSLSQPRQVAVRTAMDTLAHAVESAVTRRRTALSALFSREAFRLAARALPRLLKRPGDLEARGQMLLAAAWGGAAIEASMLGGAHAAANPLTARHGIVHGEAVSMMLPWVVRFNSRDPKTASLYAELARGARGPRSRASAAPAAEAVARTIRRLLRLSGMPCHLAQRGVTASDIPALAQDAAREWTAAFNPRPLGAVEFEHLYRAAL
jgi:alcohol dehydrogenase